MKSTDDEEISNGGDSEEQIDPRVLRQRERRMDEERDRATSELVVRVNEPDVYTPTLDLSDDPSALATQELLRQAATRPGLRRAIRTNEKNQLELVPTDEKEALEELQKEIAKYKEETSLESWVPWFWATLAVLLAALLVILLGARK